jgi:hypothetical protein
VFVEDFAPFFADHGVDATLAGVPVRGLFDAPFADALGAANALPTFMLPDAAAASAHGAPLVIAEGPGAGTWRVRSVEPDGTGLTALALERAA